MARFPRLQPNDDFVARDRRTRCTRKRSGLDVNVVHDARIVRHDVVKIPGLLKRPDHRLMRALEDANDAALGTIAPAACARIGRIASDPSDDAVAVHGGTGIFGGDEDVALVGIFP